MTDQGTPDAAEHSMEEQPDDPLATGEPLVIEEEDPLNLPPHGTEVFAGGLNKATTDEQLRDFASQAGEVFSIKLVRDPSNPTQNRGYGFVRYVTKEGALTSMDKLAETALPEYPENKVRVAPAQAKNKLYVGNISHDMTKEGLQEALQDTLKGIEKIDIVPSKDNPTQNRGFAFIEFYNGACAQHAKTILSKPDFKLGERGPLNVDFAEPTARDPMQTGVKCIFVGNLTASMTEELLKETFSKYGEVERVNFPRPKEGETHAKFGFVHFTERLAAAKAVEDDPKPTIDGVELAVKYGKSDPQQGHQHGGPGGGGFGGGRGGRGFGGRGGGGRYGGGGGGGYGGGGYQQQQQPYGGGGYGGMGMGSGGYNAGYGNPGMLMGGGGLVPVLPVQLPNGQIGYMLQGGGGGMDDGSGGYMGGGGRGGYRGGRGGGGRGYGGGGRGRGGGGGYQQGGGGGYGGGQQRYQPY